MDNDSLDAVTFVYDMVYLTRSAHPLYVSNYFNSYVFNFLQILYYRHVTYSIHKYPNT